MKSEIIPSYSFLGKGLHGNLQRAKADILNKIHCGERVYDHGEWRVMKVDGKELYYFISETSAGYPYTVVAGYKISGTGKNTGDFKDLSTVGVRKLNPQERGEVKKLFKRICRGHLNFWIDEREYKDMNLEDLLKDKSIPEYNTPLPEWLFKE